jgi:hypothetical protein
MRSESFTPMRASATHPRDRLPPAAVGLALLALALASPGPAGADWSVRPEPAAPGKPTSCVMLTEQQPLPDGYQKSWAQIQVDRQTVRVTSASQLDPGDGDIGLFVDDGPFVKFDEVVGGRTAVFRTQYDTLIEDFKRGLKVRVQLRFWPTWPKTSTHSATFSLIGFTRTHERLADCRVP